MVNRNTILKQMGIQQWRPQNAGLNSSVKQANSDVDIKPSDEGLLVDAPLDVGLKKTEAVKDAEALDKAEAPNQAEAQVQPEQDHQAVETKNPLADLDMHGLQQRVNDSASCASCNMSNSLLGAGDPQANWMFVVDAPNSRELQAQHFFAGRAGKLFEAMLFALGLSRDMVYTTSIFKCAPTEDLKLRPNCDDVLKRQIELVAPKVIIAFGEFVAQSLIKTNDTMDLLRQSDQYCAVSQSTVIATYSPAQMLNDTSLKSHVWQDMKKAINVTNS